MRFCRGERALLLESGRERVLAISDLHIGYELELAKKGFRVPSQTPLMLNRLRFLLDLTGARRLLVLGDVKHKVPGVQGQEWSETPRFFESLMDLVDDIIIVKGNHDAELEPLLPRGIRVYGAYGTKILGGYVAAQHGHAWPSPRLLSCPLFLMGHHHPVARLGENGERIPVWLVGKWDRGLVEKRLLEHLRRTGKAPSVRGIANATVVIMPAFNELVPGKVANEPGWRPRSPLLKGGALPPEAIEIYSLEGHYLGLLANLIGDKAKPAQAE
jgi:putative SbcD/Mre11-related phosphoesterase